MPSPFYRTGEKQSCIEQNTPTVLMEKVENRNTCQLSSEIEKKNIYLWKSEVHNNYILVHILKLHLVSQNALNAMNISNDDQCNYLIITS